MTFSLCVPSRPWPSVRGCPDRCTVFGLSEAGFWRDAGRLELIGRTLKDVETSTLDTESARTLLAEASRHAEGFGLKFREHILQLEADDRLQELVRRSRVAAARGESEAADPA